MPVYEFRCPECRTAYATRRDLGDLTPPICPTCNIPTRRRYSPIAFKLPMPDHYNHSTGAYVRNESEFKDQLKIQSEMATVRTGIEHNFVPHDPRESKRELNVTDEGLESTYRRRRELGLETGEEVKKLTTGKARADVRPDEGEEPAMQQEQVVWLD